MPISLAQVKNGKELFLNALFSDYFESNNKGYIELRDFVDKELVNRES